MTKAPTIAETNPRGKTMKTTLGQTVTQSPTDKISEAVKAIENILNGTPDTPAANTLCEEITAELDKIKEGQCELEDELDEKTGAIEEIEEELQECKKSLEEKEEMEESLEAYKNFFGSLPETLGEELDIEQAKP